MQEIRQIRDNLVLVAITRSNSRSIPLKASHAGADEFFLAPLVLDLGELATMDSSGIGLLARFLTSAKQQGWIAQAGEPV